jgi:hypothetical protein
MAANHRVFLQEDEGDGKESQVVDEMGELLQDWHRGAMQGIALFATWALESKIDELSSGSWRDFLVTLLGNTVWAAAAFSPPGEAALAFAISMAGIAVGSAPSIPKDVKGNVAKIQNFMYDYINKVYQQARKKRATMAKSLLRAYPTESVVSLMNKWVEASFVAAVRTVDSKGNTEPSIDLSATKDRFFLAGKMRFESMKTVQKIGPDVIGLAGAGEFAAWIVNSRSNKMGVLTVPAGGPGFSPAKLVAMIDNSHIDLAKKRHKAKWGVAVPSYRLHSGGEATVVKKEKK